MIKAIFFDLDMTILDTRTVRPSVAEVLTPILEASQVERATKDAFKQGLMLSSDIERLVAEHKIPEDVAERMRAEYQRVTMPDDTRTFGDESCLQELPTTNILVTMGYTEVQEKKVEAIDIAKYFKEVIVDEIDRPTRKGKKAIFAELLGKYDLRPDEVLAVGDNPMSELTAAQELGMKAVQTLRPSIEKWEGADYHITSLCELKSIVESAASV